MIIDRRVYDICSAFPQITSFPVYDRPDNRVAVLVRLFSHGDDQKSAKYVRTALWSMRSHMLNSDMRVVKPTVVFHVESAFADTAKPILTAAGVPSDNVIIYPTELLKPQLRRNALHKAVAPLVDRQLDEFERVLVLDADTVSLSGKESNRLVPLMNMSFNDMPADEITLLRGWRKGEVTKHAYGNWFHFAGGEEEFYRLAASHCDTTPAVIKQLCFPENPARTPHLKHNGSYINFTSSLLREHPTLREFIHDVSAAMGNEEIAFVVWAMKEYIETGRYLPSATVEDYAHSHPTFDLHWGLDGGRAHAKRGISGFVHLYSFSGILDYAFDFAKEVHATDEEAENFRDIITVGINAVLNER